MKFRVFLCAALILSANAQFSLAQPATSALNDVLSQKQAAEIKVDIVAISPVYARALGLALSSQAQGTEIETARISIETRAALKNLSALHKAIFLEEQNITAFNNKQDWANIVTSAPLEPNAENVNEQWKPQIEAINKKNTFPNAFRKSLRLDMTPTFHEVGAADIKLSFSENLTFGPENRVVKLIINPEKTGELIVAPESLKFLMQETAVLQSQNVKSVELSAREDEIIALILPPEFSARELFTKASPTMNLVVLVKLHIPTNNEPRVVSTN